MKYTVFLPPNLPILIFLSIPLLLPERILSRPGAVMPPFRCWLAILRSRHRLR